MTEQIPKAESIGQFFLVKPTIWGMTNRAVLVATNLRVLMNGRLRFLEAEVLGIRTLP